MGALPTPRHLGHLARGSGLPSALRAGPSPAGVLFGRGDLGLFEGRPCAGLIGTRRCTPEGRDVGLQLGYDSAAPDSGCVGAGAWHRRCRARRSARGSSRRRERRSPGRCRFDRGSCRKWVDVVYPRQHAALWGEVARLGQSCRRHRRDHRRRRGGSRRATGSLPGWRKCGGCGVPRKWGSWHTVEAALRRGIEVGAVPGSVQIPPRSAPTPCCTRRHPSRGAQDVLDTLGIFDHKGRARGAQSRSVSPAAPQLQRLTSRAANVSPRPGQAIAKRDVARSPRRCRPGGTTPGMRRAEPVNPVDTESSPR